MIRSIHLRGYRSLRDLRLTLDRVTVVTGGNGVGKSNFYRALGLLQRMAEGRFAEALAAEGGMPSALWAGELRRDEPKRLQWKITHEDFEFESECGLVALAPGSPSFFKTDPDIKSEALRFSGKVMARRRGPMFELREPGGKMESPAMPFHPPESILGEVRDGVRYPAIIAAREILLSWRFYHHFRTDPDSPLRRPRLGSWSPVLAHDGSNLAATLRTIIESGREAELEEVVGVAFPATDWSPVDETGGFQLMLQPAELKRPIGASELSDGTLRFFCLAAALLTPKPPPLLVLNEPEASLHAGLIGPLADLIASVPPETQVVVVTHSLELAARIGEKCGAKCVELVTYQGETRPKEQASGKRVWTFE